ncbi:MAG: hypothetical protein HRT40_05995 [Campylobacteraceae bacterium]|nr:hypothetical protein [Campylobacteraceae bacterium]
MQDKDIINIVGLPKGTIQDWKKANNYRTIIYELISNMDKEELIKKVEAIKLLKGIK